jgi:4-amino-4-deoxy-L-arabinose transferase-like glycosyltransferase
VTNAWRRLEAFVPTRKAAAALFLLALAVFWIEALGWPMAKGRDMWDYLAYYLQLFDSSPPLSELQIFRTPLTPLVLGIPLDLGGTALLEVVFGLLYSLSILAWSATALTFGRVPALFSALLLLGYPGYATLYHQASSDAIFATGLALWALLLARTLERPSGWRFAALGVGIAALVLIRPANQVLLPAVLLPLLVPAAWRMRLRWSVVCLAAALVPLGAWAVHNGIRYDDTTVARGGRAWVPFLRVFLADKTISPENGAASRRLAELIQEQVLPKEPYRSLEVPLDAYLRNGSNYETVRLIALSDRVLGREENYDVLFDSALEAIRENPGIYVRGVADAFWEFLTQRPLREGVVRRQQTAPEPPAPTFEQDGVVLPNPQTHVLVDGVPYGFVWCASDYIDSCTLARPALAWPDPGRQQRYREVVSQVRAWDAELPSRDGVSWVPEILNRITPRFPRPPLWLAVGLVGLVLRRPRGWRTMLTLWACAGLVLLIHAASQGVTPEFALPLYPIFIVTALGAVAGERAPRDVRASPGNPGFG